MHSTLWILRIADSAVEHIFMESFAVLLRRPFARGALCKSCGGGAIEAKQWRFGIGIGIAFTVGPMLVLLAHTSRVLLRSALHTRIFVFACVLFHTAAYPLNGQTPTCAWRVASAICDINQFRFAHGLRVILVDLDCDFNKKCWWEIFFPGSQSCSLPCCPPVSWWTTPQRQRAGSPKWSWVPTLLLLLLLCLSQTFKTSNKLEHSRISIPGSASRVLRAFAAAQKFSSII